MSFPKDFMWGAASAAYQVEGARDADGKGEGIWDALSYGHVQYNENGDVACDHYHRYREDVALMKQIGLKSYRFSVSWPRVMPEEDVINEKGLDFYSDLVDELLKAGIEPLVTLFHWNLPMWMQEKGGWENEEVAEHFERYAAAVVERLSDRVTWWMTINEPQVFATLGYVVGAHAPFLKKPEALCPVTRNVMLAHGRAVCAIRSHAKRPPKIGMAPTGGGVTPFEDTREGIEAARRQNYEGEQGEPFGNSWWMDPIVLGIVPEPLKGTISADDLKTICQPLDFFGFNIYNSQNYEGRVENPYMYRGVPRTAMGWSITPECLYWMPKFHYERYHLPILITENGMANCDFVMLDGKVHDTQRIDFIHRYLLELKKAVDEGIPVIGYQYWSIMDNFEWAEGYNKRFGLVYVDYRTQERILKDSALYYAEVIRTNGENL
ncbi:MAG: beta-glucosidase [Lachnospiraceae bacterium]|nr:beta-glucosidase [Lachnospiraceae bacterium]